jgi:UDP-glucose:(heptosyl)LPS alpha-1,3-glucosyltransferase
MKLAFVKQRYVPFGGGEAYLASLMDAAAEVGHDVHVIASEWGNEQKFPFQRHAAPINKFSRSSRVKSFARSVSRVVEANNFDLVFSLERTLSQHVWRAGDCVYPRWLKQRALYESWIKTLYNAVSPGQRAVVAMEARCVDQTPFIIANSEMIRDDLKATYPSLKAQVEVIRNGYDVDKFSLVKRDADRSVVRRELGIDERCPLLLFVGSGWRRKGLYELMQALPEFSGAKLVVLGRDAINKWRTLARNLGVEKQVLFLPPRMDIEKFYHAADLTVMASWYDSFGFVVLESLACGTPVVTSRFAGAHELIVPGLSGEVVSRPDALDEMRQALAEGLKLTSATAIAQSVAEYTLENNARKTLGMIERVAGS